jgi:hypothetical protein
MTDIQAGNRPSLAILADNPRGIGNPGDSGIDDATTQQPFRRFGPP